MNTASFNIGLSLLSSGTKGVEHKKLLSAEGKRVLSFLYGSPIADTEILKEDNGRPYFYDQRFDFNISHSGNIAAVSLVKNAAQSAVRTGCDIQLVKQRINTRRIACDYFSAPEKKYILAQSKNNENDTRFFEIWTLKECYLKLKGLSVFNMKTAPSFICDKGIRNIRFNIKELSPLIFFLYRLNDNINQYFLTVAIEGVGQFQPEIKWLSASCLPCEKIAEFNSLDNGL